MVIRDLTQFFGMEVTYELTGRDFFDSFIAHRNRSAFAKWTFRLIVAIVLIFAGGGLVSLAVHPNAQTLSSLAPLFALAFMWGGPDVGVSVVGGSKSVLKTTRSTGSEKMSLDSAGVHWRWNGGSADMEWRNFIRFQETRTQFLLYSSPACFNIVPKRAFTLDQMGAFRQLVAENLPLGAAHEKKISPRTWVFLGVVIVAVVLLVMAIRNIH
jgi:YcxB-like protein